MPALQTVHTSNMNIYTENIYLVSRNDIDILMSGLCVTDKQTTAARDQSQMDAAMVGERFMSQSR